MSNTGYLKKYKNIIIVTSHFPPSNLTCVHRSRYLSKYLKDFEWNPIVVTTKSEYYSNDKSDELYELLPSGLDIHRVKAISRYFSFGINDIGIRSFIYLYKKISNIVKKDKIDFLYITIPSNYIAPLGYLISKKYKIPYAIDFQDPWLSQYDGTEKLFSKKWLSYKLSSLLEPISLKNASFISSVSEKYYEDMLDKYKFLKPEKCLQVPIGIDEEDFNILNDTKKVPFLFTGDNNKFRLIYTGAMLPKAYTNLELLFKSILQLRKNHLEVYSQIAIHFIGTGLNPDNNTSYNVQKIASKYNLEDIIFEHPARINYIDVINHLVHSDGILIIGSNEKHYSPSKLFQANLAKRPILAILHPESPSHEYINPDIVEVVNIDENSDENIKIAELSASLIKIVSNKKNYSEMIIDYDASYFARHIVSKFANHLDSVIGINE